LRDPVDRREALKKMAAGGVTVIGASAVMSNMAFADFGSANCTPQGTQTLVFGNVTESASSTKQINFTLSVSGGGTCTFGPALGPRLDTEYVITGVSGNTVSSTTVAQSAWVEGRTSITTTITMQSSMKANDTITIRFDTRAVCKASGTTGACWKCVSQQAIYTFAGAAGAKAFGTPSGAVAPGSCDSPEPTRPA
jgi:hypothetical protein